MGFGVSRVQGTPKPPRQCWSHNEPSAGDLQRVCHQLTGDSTAESPERRGCPGTRLWGGAAPPASLSCFCARTCHPGPSRWEEDSTMCQQPGWPRARLSQGSTIRVGDPFLKAAGATRWLGHKCPPWPASGRGKDHSKGGVWSHQRRQGNTLVPPAPVQLSVPSVGLRPSAWAAPLHCTQ